MLRIYHIAKRAVSVLRTALVVILLILLVHLSLRLLCPSFIRLVDGLSIAGTQIAGQAVLLCSLHEKVLAVTGRGLVGSMLNGFTPPDPLVFKAGAVVVEFGSAVRLTPSGPDGIDDRLTLVEFETQEMKERQKEHASKLNKLIEAMQETRTGDYPEAVLANNRERGRTMASIGREMLVIALVAYSSTWGLYVSLRS